MVLFSVLIPAASISFADSGIINFVGQVVDGESCTTTINDQSGDKTISLPTILTSDFNGVGATPSKGVSVPFQFKVSGCDTSVSSRGVYFSLSSNDYDNLNTNLLKNNAVNGATNVGVEILEGGVPVAFNGESKRSKNITISTCESLTLLVVS
ncbi:fimbrial protein [Acinetobacter soli]